MTHIGQIYKMKRAVEDLVKIEKIDAKGSAMVTYIGREHLGLCPIQLEQCIPQPIDPIYMFEYWWDKKLQRLETLMNSHMKILDPYN